MRTFPLPHSPPFSQKPVDVSPRLCYNDLGGPGSGDYTGVLRLLDVLFSGKTQVTEKRKILQDDFEIKMNPDFESEVSSMCNFSKGIYEKGIETGVKRGIDRGILLSLRSLMSTTGWNPEKAMTALNIPEEKRREYTRLLEQ